MMIEQRLAGPSMLAQHLGVTRARATQVLQLLRLSVDVQDRIAALGDKLQSSVICERNLRPLIKLPTSVQRERVSELIQRYQIKAMLSSKRKDNVIN